MAKRTFETMDLDEAMDLAATGIQMNDNEILAEFYEQLFPAPVGKKLAALTRKSGDLLNRTDELNEKIQSESDPERLRGLVGQFLSVHEAHMRTLNQIEHQLQKFANNEF